MVSFGGKWWNQLNLGYEAISTLEIRNFKVVHMGFPNIWTEIFYICFLSIFYIFFYHYSFLVRYLKIIMQDNLKFGLNFVSIVF
jgi:hypothetical protein